MTENFSLENRENGSYLIYQLPYDSKASKTVIGMIKNNDIYGLLPFAYTENDSSGSAEYCITDLESLGNYTEKPISRVKLLAIFKDITKIYSGLKEYAIYPENIICDIDQVYVDSSNKVYLICVPCDVPDNSCDLKGFINRILASVNLDPAGGLKYADQLTDYLNSDSFSADEFCEFIDSIDFDEVPAPKPQIAENTTNTMYSAVQAYAEDPASLSATAEPDITAEPVITAEPDITGVPDMTAEPDITGVPDMTAEPDITGVPDMTAEPDITGAPDMTAEPDITGAPDVVDTENTETPEEPVHTELDNSDNRPNNTEAASSDTQENTNAMPVFFGNDTTTTQTAVQSYSESGTKEENNSSENHNAASFNNNSNNQYAQYQTPVSNQAGYSNYNQYSQQPNTQYNNQYAAQNNNQYQQQYGQYNNRYSGQYNNNQYQQQYGQNQYNNRYYQQSQNTYNNQYQQNRQYNNQYSQQQPNRNYNGYQQQPNGSYNSYQQSNGNNNAYQQPYASAQTSGNTQTPSAYIVRTKTNEKVCINKEVFRIGKEKTLVDFCITDNTAISRRLAEIIVREGKYFIIDTNSTNHIYINGRIIYPNVATRIKPGDEIILADEKFSLIIM